MNNIWCLVCQHVYDYQQGHHCVQDQSFQKSFHTIYAHLPTKEQEYDRESQLNFPVIEKESSYPTSVINELENAKLDVSAQTNIIDLQTNSDFKLPQTSECESEKMKHKFMVCNSVQTCIQESAKRETDVLVKPTNNPLSIISYYMPMDLSIRNSRILLDSCRTINTITQFSNIEVSSMSKSKNNNLDFTMPRMNIDSLMLNKTGSEFSTKDKHHRSIMKMDQLLSKNSQDHSEKRKLNTSFKSNIFAPNNKMVPKETRLSEMSHQISVSRQTLHDSIQVYDLENTSDPDTIKVNSTNEQLKSNNMSFVGELKDCTVNSTLNSHENEITFDNQNYQGDQKQIGPAQILNPDTKESIQPCFTDSIAAVIGPSCSLDSERTCHICEKKFWSKNYLKHHYKVHFGARPFICSICQRKFTDRSNLNRHVRLIHMREKLLCNICGTSFAIKNALEAHIRNHRRAKNNKCDICGKIFTRKYSLKAHIRLHTGEKPYKCDVCSRAFAWRPNLLVHFKKVHKVT